VAADTNWPAVVQILAPVQRIAAVVLQRIANNHRLAVVGHSLAGGPPVW
jgi:hypothetical protein